jgi:competence protein ComEC
MKQTLILALALAACFIRFLQAQAQFTQQQALFPQPTKGLFKVFISEEPEVLFNRESGSHFSGRDKGFYGPQVSEVRAVCTLLSFNGQIEPPVKARVTFKLSPDSRCPLLNDGETVEFDGRVELPPPPQNPGQFDYAQFLKNRGVAYSASVLPGFFRADSQAPLRGFFLGRWAAFLKRSVEERIDFLLPYPENALLSGILLGERVGLPQDLVETFIVTGTVHILAVSGLITAFVAGILFLFLRAIQLPRKAAAGLTLLGVVFFVLITGAHPPVCRAGLFSGLALLAVLFERRVLAGTLLLTTAFILVMVNPFVLTDLSFQISFLATAGLMVMAPWFLEKLSFLWKPAALVAAATLAAQLSVWVLILGDFNLLAVYSVPANLVVVPLVLFSTAGGLAALGGSYLNLTLGKLLAAGVLGPLHLLMALAGWIARWPFAQVIVATPPPGWTLLFHAWLLAAFFAYWPRPEPEKPSENWKTKNLFYRRAQKVAVGSGCLFLVFSLGLAAMDHFASPPVLRVTFLSVGHGNAVIVQSPRGRILVVDGGKETLGPDRYLPLVATLRYLGARGVDAALDTHPDEDHVGGLVNLVSAYPVARAYEGVGAHASTEIYQAFHVELRLRAVPLYFLKQGDRLAEMEPAQALILHPPVHFDPRRKADNNRSVVSEIQYPPGATGTSVLLPGDLEKEGILKLLQDIEPFPRIDWLMAPHHGRSSGEPALCARRFKPRFVVFSDGVDYPKSRALYEKNDPGVLVFSTALDGAVELEMFSDGQSRYRTHLNPRWVWIAPKPL